MNFDFLHVDDIQIRFTSKICQYILHGKGTLYGFDLENMTYENMNMKVAVFFDWFPRRATYYILFLLYGYTLFHSNLLSDAVWYQKQHFSHVYITCFQLICMEPCKKGQYEDMLVTQTRTTQNRKIVSFMWHHYRNLCEISIQSTGVALDTLREKYCFMHSLFSW